MISGPLAVPVTVFFALPLVTAYANRGATLLLVLAALGGLAAGWKRRSLAPPISRTTTLLLLAVLGWSAASAAWAYTPGLALPRLAQTVGASVAGLVLLAALPSMSMRERDTLGWAATLGLCLCLIIMGSDALTGGRARLLAGIDPYGFSPARFKIAVSIAGIFLLVLTPWHVRAGRWPVAAALITGILSMAWAASSHTGLLAASLGALTALVASWRPRLMTTVLGIALIVTFIAAPIVALRMPPVMELAEIAPSMPNSLLHRLGIWRFTAERIAEHPVLGWGFDASREIPGGGDNIVVAARDSTGVLHPFETQAMPLHPHNFFLQVWLEIGLPGALTVLLCGLSILRGLARGGSRMAGGQGLFTTFLVIGAASFGAWQSWWIACQWLGAFLFHALNQSPRAPDNPC